MRALIFTEGGKKIGLGHMTRCLALRDALKRKGIDVTMIVNADDQACACGQFRGQFDMMFDWLSQKNRTGKLLSRADMVIVDSYRAPADFYRTASKTVPVCVYIDDFIRLSYPAGVVVNGGINTEKLRYPEKKNRRCLLGIKYALLRKDFWRIPKRNTRKKIKNVLITFGGMDRTVFINKILAYLRPRFPEWHFHIITGGITARKMKKTMLSCDVAISGGGQTLNELAACGAPVVGICFARNQQLNIQGWRRHGLLIYAGRSDDPSILKKLENSLSQLTFQRRYGMGKAGQRLVDGGGASRVANEIFDSGFSFQNIRMRDRKQIFKWSNSPATRSVSFNTKPITWSEHCQWFSKKLKDSRCFFFKVMWFDRAIGQVRFDRRGRNAGISVALDKKFRGRGLGGGAIRTATQHAFETAPGILTVDALIKKNNPASVKAFLKAGFQPAGIKRIGSQMAYRFRKGKT